MHELAICQALVEQLDGVARQNGASGMSAIWVSIGPLSGVEAELLRNAWPFACAGTVAEHAVLHLQPSSVRVVCRQCGAESEAQANRLVCGACGNWQTDLVSGDELMLTRVELVHD